MEERKKRCSMQLKLEIVTARNIAIQPASKGSLFVRIYVKKKIAVNTKEVEASREPQWGETLWLECGGKGGVDEMLSALTMESGKVEIEVRWRRRIGVFGGSKSKLLGRVEIYWKEIFSYPSLSINNWFPLVVKQKGSLAASHDLTSALQIAVLVTDVQSDGALTWIQPFKIENDSKKWREGGRNEERRRRRLEREECGCGGHVCRAHQDLHFFGQA